MSRTHTTVSASLVALAFLAAHDRGAAQQQQPEKRDRAVLHAPEMRVAQVSPRLQSILENWEKASGAIKKLEGQHIRFVYENTFGAAKQSQGYFYFEAPDKGRIDILPAKIAKNAQTDRVHPKTKKPYNLAPDQAEIWIADGQNVLQIDPSQKQATLWEIPEEKRGANIMDGPLPFLFGLPAKQALERFQFQLVSEGAGLTHNQILLVVNPLWESDANNWREAKILLNKDTYLPAAVELTDPSGNQITAYSFTKFAVNQPTTLWNPFRKDPFKYPLGSYQVKVNHAGPQQAQQGPSPSPQGRGFDSSVPSVLGMSHVDARKVLEKEGFRVEMKPGSPAPTADLVYTVQEQRVDPDTPAGQAKTVFLFLYNKQAISTNKPESRTTAKPQTNAVR
jgi:TIGR03009 family protein